MLYFGALRPEASRVLQSHNDQAGSCALTLPYLFARFVHRCTQAFKKHALADPLKDAGEADLTANVDFAYLRSALQGTEGEFWSAMRRLRDERKA